MREPQLQTALAHRNAPDTTFIDVREIATRGMIDVRGHTSGRNFLTAMKDALGVELPRSPRTSASWGDVTVLWLSVDQWLVTCPRDKADALTAKLQTAAAGTHSLIVNVSDMRAIIRLEGEGCRDVVMKGTSTDLMEGFPQGTVKRMRFAEIAAMLHVVEENTLDIYVFRSYADYAWEFIVKAARKGSEVRLFAASIE